MKKLVLGLTLASTIVASACGKNKNKKKSKKTGKPPVEEVLKSVDLRKEIKDLIANSIDGTELTQGLIKLEEKSSYMDIANSLVELLKDPNERSSAEKVCAESLANSVYYTYGVVTVGTSANKDWDLDIAFPKANKTVKVRCSANGHFAPNHNL